MERPAHIYRRDLPHIQNLDGSYFVTSCTCRGMILPEAVRDTVIDCCKYVHSRSAFVHCVVVMPDHVHLILTPRAGEGDTPALLHNILKGL